MEDGGRGSARAVRRRAFEPRGVAVCRSWPAAEHEAWRRAVAGRRTPCDSPVRSNTAAPRGARASGHDGVRPRRARPTLRDDPSRVVNSLTQHEVSRPRRPPSGVGGQGAAREGTAHGRAGRRAGGPVMADGRRRAGAAREARRVRPCGAGRSVRRTGLSAGDERTADGGRRGRRRTHGRRVESPHPRGPAKAAVAARGRGRSPVTGIPDDEPEAGGRGASTHGSIVLSHAPVISGVCGT